MAGTDARGELYPYTFSADARYEIEELLSEVIDLMRSSEVLRKRGLKALLTAIG
jgi:hypothetical protein